MPRKTIKDKQARADLLAKIPHGAARVQVLTAKGELKYKAVIDLADSDEIQTNKYGDPVVMKGNPGRKTPITVTAPAVVAPANATVAAVLQRKAASLAHDPVYRTTQKAPDSPDVLHQVMLGLSEEAASLKFERDEAARNNEGTANLSAKRVQALRAVGDTWLKRMDQMAGKLIDLDSPGFLAVYKLLMETMREAMNGAKLRDEQIETVFAKFASLVNDEWKVEAKNRMKNVV